MKKTSGGWVFKMEPNPVCLLLSWLKRKLQRQLFTIAEMSPTVGHNEMDDFGEISITYRLANACIPSKVIINTSSRV